MKSIVFDTGPIISFATNNLLEVFKKLKKSFNGEFYITSEIKREVIDRPMDSKKYKFEAIQFLKQYQDGVFKLYPSTNLKEMTEKILYLANNSFKAFGNYIQIVHYAEIEVLAAAIELKADAVVIDERTTRVLIENPQKVKERLEKKLHTQVEINRENIKELKVIIEKISVIRSFELITIAYEKGFLDEYVISNIKDSRKNLLEGVLWSVKLSGCAVSEEEIKETLALEKT